MKLFFETPVENRAYMEGYVAGKKADGLDWVRAEMEKADAQEKIAKAWQEMLMIRDAALAALAEKDREIEELRSQVRAYQIAFRSVDADLEEAVRITQRRKGRRL